MRAAIAGYKFEGRADLGLPLGDYLATHVRGEQALALSELVMPVPLHRERLRERGFDHAVPLARAVATALGIPLAAGILVRARATSPQAGLMAKARRANVRDAFHADPARAHLLKDRRIVLVDDILTSGATASACAEALAAAGAAEVRVATLARAILGGLPRNGGAATG